MEAATCRSQHSRFLAFPVQLPKTINIVFWASRGSVIKNLPANAGDTRDVGSIPGSGRYPGEGNGNPLQYSCLENPVYRVAWQAIVHGVAKSHT